MAVTPREVFELALALMDELSWPGGEADVAENGDFKARTLPILTLLVGECRYLSQTYAPTAEGARPLCPPPSGFDDPIPGLEDDLCRTVLPYGLAAHLLMEQNPDAAALFRQKYNENRALFHSLIPISPHPVEDVYGLEHNGFGGW